MRATRAMRAMRRVIEFKQWVVKQRGNLFFGVIVMLGVAWFLNRLLSPNKYLVVRTENGSFRGSMETSLRSLTKFYAFRGIPYAEPPVGRLRFKVMNYFFWHFGQFLIV